MAFSSGLIDPTCYCGITEQPQPGTSCPAYCDFLWVTKRLRDISTRVGSIHCQPFRIQRNLSNLNEVFRNLKILRNYKFDGVSINSHQMDVKSLIHRDGNIPPNGRNPHFLHQNIDSSTDQLYLIELGVVPITARGSRVLTRKNSQRGGKTSSPCPLCPPPPPPIRWKFDRYAEPHLYRYAEPHPGSMYN